MSSNFYTSYWKIRLFDIKWYVGWMLIFIGFGISALVGLIIAVLLGYQQFEWLSSGVWISASLNDALNMFGIEITRSYDSVSVSWLASIARWFLDLHVSVFLLAVSLPVATGVITAGLALYKRPVLNSHDSARLFKSITEEGVQNGNEGSVSEPMEPAKMVPNRSWNGT